MEIIEWLRANLSTILIAAVPLIGQLLLLRKTKSETKKIDSESGKINSEAEKTDAETEGLIVKNASSVVELWQAAYKELKDKTDAMQEASRGRDMKINALEDIVVALKNKQRDMLAFVANILDVIREPHADVFAITDEKKKIVYISPNVFEVLGYSPLDFLGKDRTDLIHPDDLPNFERVFSYSLQFPEITSKLYMRFMHHDGNYRHMEATIMNLLQTHVQGIFFSSRDVTKIKIAEDEFKRLYAEQ